MGRWLLRVALAALVVGTLAGAGMWVRTLPLPFRGTTPGASSAPEGRGPAGAERPRQATGGLRVGSTPPGARVILDGKDRGTTPLTLEEINPGQHVVELESGEGRIRRSVAVVAGQTASIDEMIFSGWLAVYAPFELSIAEGDRPLHLDDRSQIMLPAGSHQLRLTNQALGYAEIRSVELKPGAVTTLSVTPPRSTLTVTATERAEVWLDGARVGEAPVFGLPVNLGTHDVLLRRSNGADRRSTITITVKPFTLDVDFSKPQH
jgi:hypothetical protein